MKNKEYKFLFSLSFLVFSLSVDIFTQEILPQGHGPKYAYAFVTNVSESITSHDHKRSKNVLPLRRTNLGRHYSTSFPGDGLVIDHADQIGINILSPGSNAIQVSSAGVDGLQVQSAGRDGLRVSAAAEYGINVTGTLGAGYFAGNVIIDGDMRATNIGINTTPYLNTKISVVGNTGFSGNMFLTSGTPGAAFASNILEVQQNSPTDPIADAWTTYSSRRWKKNIRTIDQALERVKRLRGVSYEWKKDNKTDIGLIAEEVGEVFPEIVAFEENGVDAKSVDYARLVAVLIEAIKEQQVMIDALNHQMNP